jgi:hypothetical protein
LAWTVLPPRQIVGNIAGLKVQAKEAYIVVVSMSFALDTDLSLARERLTQLNDQDTQGTVRALAERYIIELKPDAQRRSLAKLASALGADSVTLRVYASAATPITGVTASPGVQPTTLPTPVPQATETARPPNVRQIVTAQPSATASSLDYRVYERMRLTCQQETGPKPHIAIFVQDAAGKGLPGIKVRIQWNDGEDTFFTGLKGSDPGYAEYEVQAGKSYSISVVEGTSQVALGLNADALEAGCPSDGKEHFRAWRIIFRRLT